MRVEEGPLAHRHRAAAEDACHHGLANLGRSHQRNEAAGIGRRQRAQDLVEVWKQAPVVRTGKRSLVDDDVGLGPIEIIDFGRRLHRTCKRQVPQLRGIRLVNAHFDQTVASSSSATNSVSIVGGISAALSRAAPAARMRTARNSWRNRCSTSRCDSENLAASWPAISGSAPSNTVTVLVTSFAISACAAWAST